MFGPLNEALEAFHKKWHALVAARVDPAFFGSLKIAGVGWKTEDMAEFDHLFKQLRAVSSQAHLAWINERWIATFILRDPGHLCCEIPLVKLMQRRPGSNCPVGLDHVDFLLPKGVAPEEALAKEPDLTWTPEANEPHSKWISLRFDDCEAKLRTETTISACISELQEAEAGIVQQ